MKWQIVLKRDEIDLTTICAIDTVFFNLLKEFKGNSEGFFTFFDKKRLIHYTNADLLEWGRFLVKKYFNSISKIEKYHQEGEKFLGNVLERTSKEKDLKNDFEEFKKGFLKICNIYSINSWLALEAWQQDYEKVGSRLIKQSKIKDEDKMMASLFKPWKKTAIHEIQEKLKEGKRLVVLAKEYQSLRSWSAIWHRDINKEWIEKLKPSKEEIVEFYSTKELIDILKPNLEERKIVEIAPYMIFFKDYRDDVRRKFNYYWKGLFERLSKKFEVEYDDLGYLSLEELEECITNDKFYFDKVKNRKKNPCVVIFENEQVKVIDEVPKKYLQIVSEVEGKEKSLEVKGVIACKGIVKGEVRIINSYHDLKKVANGDILVANTTHPNYLPAMQRAAAFITNEGGMISHAAIVARELKKPCVVGTKTATKVLKDGDYVEVDANKGVVRKI
ncbi:MAG: PEP-utilizing enzyme [Candidatus Woesearchaeota archaeon]